ncbi:FMN-binding protein [Desulfopila sp. IMCC35006]|uniref:FMN-binding protein n=1 Tax=Desulfopila sp. IMCC35006 TaxID=2569542 RepID=UPI0010AD2921|nr:FMN-binding protein [Desulfopila sp. IMCC35006]TKB27542.1 FMN-binding protein [Desulfopila sp. IMCC35006]
MSEIIRMVVVLSVIAGFSAAALTTANIQLGPRVDAQIDLYVRGPALERLFHKPAKDVLGNKVVIDVDGVGIPVFYTLQDKVVSTLAIEAIGKGGFGGDLKLMVGIDLIKERQTGIEVVSHSETPGLGARIVEIAFRRQWQGLPIDTPVALTADGGAIDAISGASTTSRAAVNGTNSALDFVRERKAEILKLIAER